MKRKTTVNALRKDVALTKCYGKIGSRLDGGKRTKFVR
jgi:hypothetical protein